MTSGPPTAAAAIAASSDGDRPTRLADEANPAVPAATSSVGNKGSTPRVTPFIVSGTWWIASQHAEIELAIPDMSPPDMRRTASTQTRTTITVTTGTPNATRTSSRAVPSVPTRCARVARRTWRKRAERLSEDTDLIDDIVTSVTRVTAVESETRRGVMLTTRTE
ncbi:hypothetical protein GOOTI_108_00290 [Gordonia otitidis NBRC 100426]|uniref:Uncharacterized protein n=1 Tax=Gordonia otitidis (strain DSM 44809 / CCUG 52243 / JCM 12355 / NBRC 100426 / IFM 10032) TaxID=1108044 RepID=H5TLS9_GORO1|nr:hypothetical protein GOOTI_108_00290 [Gordonia otitidis NBRC 100426]